MNGKGDRNRPKSVSLEEWDKKYQEIFGSDKEEKKKKCKRKCKSTKD
jgi:hypothetical protein